MVEMGLTAAASPPINPARYATLLGKALPRVIQSEEEFDRLAAMLEKLDFPGRALDAEEQALAELLTKLIEDYDDRRHVLPNLPPGKMLRYLIAQRDLRQRDLVPLLGASSVVSDIVHGKRSQAKKLAVFFRVSADVSSEPRGPLASAQSLRGSRGFGWAPARRLTFDVAHEKSGCLRCR